MSELDVYVKLNTEVMADPAATLANIQKYLQSIGEPDKAAKAVNLLGLEGGASGYNVVLSDFQYSNADPTFSPTLVVDRIFVNDSDATLSDTFTYNKTLQEAQTFSFTEGLKVGTKASAKVSLPLVGGTDVEVSAEVSFGATQTFATTTTQSWTQSSTINVPSHQSVKVVGLVKLASNVHRAFTGYAKVKGGTFNFLLSSTTDPSKQWLQEWYLEVPIGAVLTDSQRQFPVAGSWSGALGVAVMITAGPVDAKA